MFWNSNNQDDKSDSLEKERSHQDNFWSNCSYNNKHQYCRFCNRDTRFEYDRCSICKNN